MKKDIVILRLCRLTTLVMAKKFHYLEPADCFCTVGYQPEFQFSEKILEFLEAAVAEKLAREKE